MKDSATVSKKFYKNMGVKGLESFTTPKKTSDFLKKLKKVMHFSKNDTIIELACGYGRLVFPLAKQGYNIQGIDLMFEFIKEARKRARKHKLNIKFDLGDMRKLPYENNCFDKIFCVWSSFNHLLTINDQLKTIGEIYRVLKPRGVAFLELVNGELNSIQEGLRKEGKGKDKRIWGHFYCGMQLDDYVHSRKTMDSLCKKSKFKKFKVGFMNVHNRRRLVAYLYKNI